MPANINHLQSLFEKYMNNTCTKAEWEELLQLVREETHEDDLTKAFRSYWNNLSATENNPAYWNEKFNTMMKEISSKENGHTKNRKVIPIRSRWMKWTAAAAILFIAVAGLWIVIDKHTVEEPPVAVKANDVQAPQNTRAVITLADGSKVYLDSAGNGVLAQQNNVNLVKTADGQLVYMSPAGGGGLNASPNNKQPGVDINTLFNPRGSKVISLTLSDGTKVWLNSESSLRYPASFAGNTREVEITGEAYLEVKHNAKQPFKVHLPNGSIVEDIGTSFNVNAYPDEEATKTTLIEGAVKITAANAATAAVKLKPGEQAAVNPANPSIRKILVQDIDEVTAWKNGTFSYTNSDLETIMRQMARWYDVDVIYKDRITDRYTVDVPRTVPVSQLFKFIEMSGGVHFEIEGKKIIVSK